MNLRLILPVLAFLAALLAVAAFSAAALSTEPEVESKEVEKDGVSVSVLMKRAKISADEQPEFIVRFKNVGKEEYRNLYEVTAYWNWTIELTDADSHATKSGPWRLHMNAIPSRVHLEHRQIKPSESTDVIVNLNDPPFTFEYVYAAKTDKKIAPIRHLKPGLYQLTAKVGLTNPFGPGYFEWCGPVMTKPVALTVTEAPQKPVTKEEQAAYGAAIAKVTDKLQPGGLWMNGLCPKIDLPKDAKSEDVIDAAVNNTSLDSKAYRVLSVKPMSQDQIPGEASGTTALLQVGKSYKVAIFYPFGAKGWWSRFYDTEVVMPPTSTPNTGGAQQTNH